MRSPGRSFCSPGRWVAGLPSRSLSSAVSGPWLRLPGRSFEAAARSRSGGDRCCVWRVGPQYYAYALGLPLLIMLALNLALSALGAPTDWSALPARIPAYLQSFLLTAIVFGGQEEPGWRGFALPLLERRHSPWAATLILGLGWGIWHVPLYGFGGFRRPVGARLFLHMAVQQDRQRSALHPAARQLHPCPRPPAVQRRLDGR